MEKPIACRNTCLYRFLSMRSLCAFLLLSGQLSLPKPSNSHPISPLSRTSSFSALSFLCFVFPHKPRTCSTVCPWSRSSASNHHHGEPAPQPPVHASPLQWEGVPPFSKGMKKRNQNLRNNFPGVFKTKERTPPLPCF